MKIFSLLIAILAWFSVITQFVLMMDHRVAPVGETIIRFFSYFTILTNILVALYFTFSYYKVRVGLLKIIDRSGTLTAVTIYILIVGLVYQVLLRHVWEPTGMQMIVDELLHTIIPGIVLVYWIMFGTNTMVAYKDIRQWMVYPLGYLFFILVRGYMSGFYPYPFVDVGTQGIEKVVVNSVSLMLCFIGLSAFFIFVRRSWRANREGLDRFPQ